MRYTSFTDAVAQLTIDGEIIKVVGPSGHICTGELWDIGPDLLRVRPTDSDNEVLINPAHVVSITLKAVEP